MKTTMWKAGLVGALSLASISMAPAAFAADDDAASWDGFSTGVTLTSDYRFRGVSNSDRGAAAQGYVQYDHASGFFGNVWFSTIDFNDEPTYDSSIEVDLTAGYNYAFSEQTTGTVKAIYYWYADADTPAGMPDYDYFELAAGISHDFGEASVSGEIAWSPDYFAEVGDSVALTGGVSYPVMESFLFFDGGLEASGHVGYQWIDDNAAALIPDYFFYDIGATASWGIISVDLRWVGTDVDNNDCSAFDVCEGGVVLSVSADLPG
jgi:uncharacterized protein (TIGR02001 family)